MLGPTSRTYFSQRLRLHYVDWGNEDAPPLILQHGGRDHCRNWDWVADALRNDWHIIAPDLRGHGDSEWPSDGQYAMSAYVYDLAQLIHQQNLAPVRIVAHSLGGSIALRYAGIFPDNVAKLVAIEGVGLIPRSRAGRSIVERMRDWVGEQRGLSGRQARRYGSIEDAFARMQEENKYLTPAQALHLTHHGVNQNEDGTYSWKFDNYVRSWPPNDITEAESEELYGRIACPTLLVNGRDSWVPDPVASGRLKQFRNARALMFDGAGHWVHHDQLDRFVAAVKKFL
jgi:pimeloyl-ACP methyl ester carboxylesterase